MTNHFALRSVVLSLFTLVVIGGLMLSAPPLRSDAGGPGEFVGWHPNASTSARSVTLQQGANGYTGTLDTFIGRATWMTPPQYTLNYGQNPAVRVSDRNGDVPLLRFELSSLRATRTGIATTAILCPANRSRPPSARS